MRCFQRPVAFASFFTDGNSCFPAVLIVPRPFGQLLSVSYLYFNVERPRLCAAGLPGVYVKPYGLCIWLHVYGFLSGHFDTLYANAEQQLKNLPAFLGLWRITLLKGQLQRITLLFILADAAAAAGTAGYQYMLFALGFVEQTCHKVSRLSYGFAAHGTGALDAGFA